MLWDLISLKRVLEIPLSNTTEDGKLLFFGQQATSIIEELLGRPVSKQERTEFPRPSGTQRLLLKHRPVFTTPTIRTWIDESGYYGSTSGSFGSQTELTYGEGFCLQVDESDGTSRCGLLVRIGNVWPKPSARQRGLLSPFITDGYGMIKVQYTGGWTVDSLPASLTWACNLLIQRMRYIMPLGMEISSDSWEDKSYGYSAERRQYLMALVRPHVMQWRNWTW